MSILSIQKPPKLSAAFFNIILYSFGVTQQHGCLKWSGLKGIFWIIAVDAHLNQFQDTIFSLFQNVSHKNSLRRPNRMLNLHGNWNAKQLRFRDYTRKFIINLHLFKIYTISGTWISPHNKHEQTHNAIGKVTGKSLNGQISQCVGNEVVFGIITTIRFLFHLPSYAEISKRTMPFIKCMPKLTWAFDLYDDIIANLVSKWNSFCRNEAARWGAHQAMAKCRCHHEEAKNNERQIVAANLLFCML